MIISYFQTSDNSEAESLSNRENVERVSQGDLEQV